jgi:hypothetical protein
MDETEKLVMYGNGTGTQLIITVTNGTAFNQNFRNLKVTKD